MRLTDMKLNLSRYDRDAYGRVILVGMFLDGPIGRPFSLPSSSNPYTYLGDNHVTRKAVKLIDMGVPAERIIYYRLNGQNSRVSFFDDNYTLFDIVGVTGSDKQNNITCTVSAEGLTLRSHYTEEQLIGRETNYVRTYRFDEYPYLEHLASAINQDATLGLVDVIARDYAAILSKDAFTIGEYPLSEGNNGEADIQGDVVEIESYFELFANQVLGSDYDGHSYKPIVEIPAEILLFPDITIESSPQIGSLAAGIAKQKTEDQQVFCSAIFNTQPVPESGVLEDDDYMSSEDMYYSARLDDFLPYEPYVAQQQFAQNLLSLYTDDELSSSLYDHLMIVIGEDMSDGNYASDTYLASMLLRSSPYDTLANKTIPNYYLNNILEKSIVANLTTKGYICSVPSVRRGHVFPRIQNMRSENAESLLTQWANLRFLGQVKLGLTTILDKYIGSTFGFFTMSKVEREIEEFFMTLRQYNRLAHATLDSIDQDINNQSVNIQISIGFVQEIRQIQANLQVTNEGWDLDLWNLVD